MIFETVQAKQRSMNGDGSRTGEGRARAASPATATTFQVGVLLLCLLSTAFGGSETTIFLVRHAEKELTADKDPGLTPEGRQRADQLAHMLAKAGIKAIYATQYRRTRETAEPLARILALPIQAIRAEDTKALTASILENHRGQAVLVAGHSNTLPGIIRTLGGGEIEPITELEYDNLYQLTVSGDGVKLIRLRFGNPFREPESGFAPR